MTLTLNEYIVRRIIWNLLCKQYIEYIVNDVVLVSLLLMLDIFHTIVLLLTLKKYMGNVKPVYFHVTNYLNSELKVMQLRLFGAVG